jgi:multiple sugar transport system permease protein
MSLPLAAMVLVFFLVPLVLMLWMSVNHWPLLGSTAPNGFKNYEAVTDDLFLGAVGFTVKYAIITTVVMSLVALALALLVQESRRGIGFIRTSIFLPSAIGFASTCYLFFAQFQLPDSALNATTRTLGLTSTQVDWLGTTDSALASTVALIVWRFAGFYMLILLTGIQAIPGEVYEAARMDGANRWQTIRRITIPLLRPSITLMLVLSVTGSLLVFEPFYILTQGRPDNTTVSVVMTVYRQAFTLFDLGTAAAMSVVVLAVLFVVSSAQLISLRNDH